VKGSDVAWIQHEDLGPSPTAVISTNPSAMQAVRELNQELTFGSSALTPVQEESIATTVSVINKCRY